MAKTPPTPQGKLFELAAKPRWGVDVAGRALYVHEAGTKRCFDIDSGQELALPVDGPSWPVRSRDRGLRRTKTGVEVIDLAGKVIATLVMPEGDGFLGVLRFSDPLDRAGTIVCGSQGPNAYVWDARTGQLVHAFTAIGYVHASPSPNGSLVAFATAKTPLRIASTSDYKLVEIPDAKSKGSNIVWSPDSASLVLHSSNEAIVIDVKSRKVTTRFKLPAWECLFVPHRNAFLAGGRKRISIWDATTWKQRGEVPVSARFLTTTATGDRIITGGDQPTTVIWDTDPLLGASKVVAKKQRAKPAKRKVRAMFFGVPRKVSEKKIIDAIVSLHDILDRQPPEFAMRLLPADGKRDRHWFHIVGTRGRNYLLEPWIESLQTDFKTPLDVVMHDDIWKTVEARRYHTPFASKPIEVAPDYLGVLDVPDPVLVIERGRRFAKHVKPSVIASLVHCVQLSWP